jgi:hypothetical protein
MVSFYVIVAILILTETVGVWAALVALALPRLIQSLRQYSAAQAGKYPSGEPMGPLVRGCRLSPQQARRHLVRVGADSEPADTGATAVLSVKRIASGEVFSSALNPNHQDPAACLIRLTHQSWRFGRASQHVHRLFDCVRNRAAASSPVSKYPLVVNDEALPREVVLKAMQQFADP